MSVTIILQSPNTATITHTGAVSATIQHTGAVSATIQQIVGQGVSVQNVVPNAVTINSSMAASTWGSITGTITNQTDLVNYITSRLPYVPYKTALDIVDALNSLSEQDEFKLSVRPLLKSGLKFAEEADNYYTLPSYGNRDLADEAGVSRYGWFLFSDTDGSLYWKQFPLQFIQGFNEAAKVDGGDF